MPSDTLAEFEAKLRALLAGAQTVLSPTTVLMMYGKSVTQAQIMAVLQDQIALIEAARAAKAEATAAVAAKRAGAPAVTEFARNLAQSIRLLYPVNSLELTKFGMAPPKIPAPLSAGKKTIANVRRANTRAARGIKGKRQRAAIQPNVAPLQVTIGPDGKPTQVTPAPAATSKNPDDPVKDS